MWTDDPILPRRTPGAVPPLFRCGTVFLFVALALPGLARAQAVRSFELERLTPTPGSEHSMILETGDAIPGGTVKVSLLAQYERNPLLLKDRGVLLGAIVSSRLSANLGLAWSILDWFQLGLCAPVVLSQAGDSLLAEGLSPVTATAVGSPVVSGRFTLVREASGAPLDLGFSLALGLPLGSGAAYTRDPGTGLRFTGKLGAGRTLGTLVRVGVEAGLELRETETLTVYSSAVRDEIGSLYSIGATASTLGAGLRGEVTGRAIIPLTKTGIGVEVLGGLRAPLAHRTIEVFAMGGFGAGQLPGTPTFRVLAGLAWTPGAGGAEGSLATRLEAAPAVHAPPVDRDGDSVPDESDECVDVPGSKAMHGCPAPVAEEAVAEATSEEWLFDTRVTFRVGSAELSPPFRARLAEVARVFQGRTDLEALIVVGHTDSTGSHAYNQRLSERRAAAVRQALVELGVEASKLEVRGFGKTQPVASNADGTGRAFNRRTEFATRRLLHPGTPHDDRPVHARRDPAVPAQWHQPGE